MYIRQATSGDITLVSALGTDDDDDELSQLDAPLLPHRPSGEGARKSGSQDLRLREDGEAGVPVPLGVGSAVGEERGHGKGGVHL